MSTPSVSRSVSLFALVILSTQCLFFASRSFAQKLNNLDAAVTVFGQSTQSSSGNGIRDSPTESMGGLGTFRQSFKPWLGYELNYSYSRFSERYSSFPFAVQSNLHEATGAYLLQAPKLFFVQPFAAVGGGWTIYLPTNTGGQHFNQQFQLAFLYELGLNYPIATDHFGLRVEYRGLVGKTPSFNQSYLNTGAIRQTSEAAAGFYVRF